MSNHMENVDIIVNKKQEKGKDAPKKEDFLQYCKEKCAFNGLNYLEYQELASAKYDAWVENGWKDMRGVKIQNWRSKVNATFPISKNH